MTTATLTQALRSTSLFDALARVWAEFRTALARRQAIAVTRAELNLLSDRELDDLGLSRADIEDAARRAVYGH